MKGKDRAIMAVILAAALAVGLVLVRRALEHAAQTQAASLAAAQFNGGDGEGTGEDSVQTMGGTSSAGNTGQPEDGEPGEMPGQEGEAQNGGETWEGESSQPSQNVPEEAPSAGGGAKTLAELTNWMSGESSAALAARSKLEAEQALGAGIGTADDALRRTFAQSQAEANYAARQNELAEQAAALGYEYLKCRELLALREESVAFWQSLEEAVAAQAGEDDGREETRQADLQTVQELLAAEKLALEGAQANLAAAAEALNAALGNPYGTELTVTDTLAAEPLPTLSGDAAATQALELRNEIKEARYQVQREEQILTQLRYQYAPASPEVLEQQAAVQEARAAETQVETQVEADVRDQLTRLGLQAQELDQCSAALEQTGMDPPQADYVLESGAEEGTWSSNLSRLREQWTAISDNRAAWIAGVARFNLDVLCFQHAVGVGCTAAEI